MNLHENIKRLRQEAKLNQDQVAVKLGVQRSRYAKWEEGRASPDLDLIFKIMELYNVNIYQLAGVEPSKIDFTARYNTADENVKGAIDLLLK